MTVNKFKDKRLEELRTKLIIFQNRLEELYMAQSYMDSNYFWVRVRQIEYLIDDILGQL
jgi:hypothetical protein